MRDSLGADRLLSTIGVEELADYLVEQLWILNASLLDGIKDGSVACIALSRHLLEVVFAEPSLLAFLHASSSAGFSARTASDTL